MGSIHLIKVKSKLPPVSPRLNTITKAGRHARTIRVCTIAVLVRPRGGCTETYEWLPFVPDIVKCIFRYRESAETIVFVSRRATNGGIVLPCPAFHADLLRNRPETRWPTRDEKSFPLGKRDNK